MHTWAYMQLITGFVFPFRSCLLGLILLILVSEPLRLRASSSGLNNIPTADTAPNLTLVIQEYTTAGANRQPTHFAGFKFGVDPWKQSAWRSRFELGLDGYVAPRDAGPPVLQVKYSTQPRPKLPALSFGVANLASGSQNRDRGGQPFCYAVLTHDFRVFRFHGGYGLQAHNNNTPLLGVDRSFKLFQRDLMVRADAIQIEHRQNWLASFGGLYSFSRHFVLESWWNQRVHGGPGSITIKFNVVIPF